jgi:hypothetical protein
VRRGSGRGSCRPAHDRGGAAQRAQVKLGLCLLGMMCSCVPLWRQASRRGVRTQRPLVFSASTYHLRRSGHTPCAAESRALAPDQNAAQPLSRKKRNATRPSGSKPASPLSVPSNQRGATAIGSLRNGDERVSARASCLSGHPRLQSERRCTYRARHAPQSAVSLRGDDRGGPGRGAGSAGAASDHRASNGGTRGQHGGSHSSGVRLRSGCAPPAAAAARPAAQVSPFRKKIASSVFPLAPLDMALSLSSFAGKAVSARRVAPRAAARSVVVVSAAAGRPLWVSKLIPELRAPPPTRAARPRADERALYSIRQLLRQLTSTARLVRLFSSKILLLAPASLPRQPGGPGAPAGALRAAGQPASAAAPAIRPPGPRMRPCSRARVLSPR